MFQPIPDSIDIMSPEKPVLLILDADGQTYRGQTGGVCCNHPEATGIVRNIRHARKLGAFLDGSHHRHWCGWIDSEGLAAIDMYFEIHGIPLRTCGGYSDEGWVSVDIIHGDEDWQYLAEYVGRDAILVWNNCD